jgi:hypothetical protein
MALTGVLAERVKANSTDGILKPNVRIFSGIQIGLFFIGLALVVYFGWKAS